MTTISRFEIDGEIGSLRGAFGSWHQASLTDPVASNVPLWSIGPKQYNHYVIDTLNFINLIMPEISQTNALIGYNVTIINSSINSIMIRDFNNNIIMELMAKKSVKLIASDLLQNWTFSSTSIKNNLLPGVGLLESSISDYEYVFKNLISSDSSVAITDLSNQIDLKATPFSSPVSSILDIYLSTTGSDANDGLTPATPVENLTRALQISNQLGWNDQINLNFAAGNYVLPIKEPYVFKYTAAGLNRGAYVFKGDAPTLLAAYTIAATNNVTLSPTQLATINPGVPIVADAYNGRFILMTSGANAGKYYQIAENTAAEIYLLTDESFGIGDTFEIYQNSTSITTRGNRFTDGYLIMSNIDFILEDHPIVNPTEIYSWEVIDSFVIHDNVCILTNPGVTGPYILYYNDTLIASDNTHIFSDSYVSSNLGTCYIGSNLANPADNIRIDNINSFVSTSKVYVNRTLFNYQNSQMFSFLYYYRNVTGIQLFASNSYFGQVVFMDCNATTGLIQLDNNASLFIDSMLQVGFTTVLLRISSSSTMFMNNTSISIINVIGNVEGLSFLNLSNVTISNMIGTDPNRTFSHSHINFSGCNITSALQVITFNCCMCVSFDSVNIFGDLELLFNNSSTAFNNFTINSTRPMTFNNSRIMAGNMNFQASAAMTRMSLNQSVCTFDTLNLSEVLGGGYIITANNSIISINNIFIANPGTNPLFALGFTNTTLMINNLDLTNLNSDFSFQSTSSVIYVGSLNSTVPGTNYSFNVTSSNMTIYNTLNHDGNLAGNTYFILNVNTSLRINNINFNNCLDTFCAMGSGCSLLIDNGNTSNTGKFLSKSTQDFNLVQIYNVNFNNITTASDFIDLQGGKIVLGNVFVGVTSAVNNYIMNLDNCSMHMNNTTLDSGAYGCFNLERMSRLRLFTCTLKANPNATFDGIRSNYSEVYADNSSIDNYDNGINLIRKSSAIIDNVVGTNSNYGLILNSGSSISQNASNNVTGATSDVYVGALGNRTWVAVNGGAAADTNDYSTPNPQYVSISPA